MSETGYNRPPCLWFLECHSPAHPGYNRKCDLLGLSHPHPYSIVNMTNSPCFPWVAGTSQSTSTVCSWDFMKIYVNGVTHIFMYVPWSCELRFPSTSLREHKFKNKIIKNFKMATDQAFCMCSLWDCEVANTMWLCLCPYFLPWLTWCTHHWELSGTGAPHAAQIVLVLGLSLPLEYQLLGAVGHWPQSQSWHRHWINTSTTHWISDEHPG